MPIIRNNQTEFTFNNIYYVDSLNGSDSNNGSNNSPFLTVSHAISKCSLKGDAIFAKAGTYDVTRIAGDFDSGGLWDGNKEIYFFGQKEKTIFLCDGTKHSGRDTHCIMFQNSETKAYNITFDFKIGNRNGNNYQNSICGFGGGAVKGELVNCLFKIDSLIPNFTYSNNGTSTTKFTNCVFDVKANFVGSYSGQGFTIENCVTNFTFYNEGTRKNTYSRVTFDSSYHITNYGELDLGIGVYAGSYSWAYSWGLSSTLLRANGKTFSLESIKVTHETKMTNITVPTPFVASASGHYGSGYEPYKAFNGTAINASDTWISSRNTIVGWIQIDYGASSPKIANVLELTGRNSSVLTDNVKDFNILGSNDSVNFDTLAQIRNQIDWAQVETRRFDFENDKPYRYYRIQVLDNNGYSYVAIGEILFSYEKLTLFEVPVLSTDNIINYGKVNLTNLTRPIPTELYILQDDSVSKNEQGLWTKQVNKKPLSISFN
ncbi:discoidin domain-containing protein [Lysinibacillus sp. FSL M8-0216]|uniref:discoidin domain-containing protein n=1 Tax=Lysinibacillus sp. FSL M8-0216 TaxID=2921619 RepID=UPI00315A0FC7